MYIKNIRDCHEFTAGDETILRECLHPASSPCKTSYSLAHAVVFPGKESLPHILKTSEVYYILDGEGIMHIDSEISNVVKDDVIYIPPGAVQYIKNIGSKKLRFLCIVDPAWKVEDEEIL